MISYLLVQGNTKKEENYKVEAEGKKLAFMF
jgi:hypothetical protein